MSIIIGRTCSPIEHLVPGLDPGGNFKVPPSIELPVTNRRMAAEMYASPNQVRLLYGFAGYGQGHPNVAALDILTKIIGGGRTSSLTQRLRYERGLVYSVRASSIEEVGFGYWLVRTSTDPGRLSEVTQLINSEFERAIAGKITQDELNQAKAILINSIPLRLDTVEVLLNAHISQDLYAMSGGSRVMEWIEAVRTTTLHDITRVARDTFVPQTSLMTLYGDVSKIGEVILF